MLSRFSSVSSKRLIFSALKKFLANSEAKLSDTAASILTPASLQVTTLSHFCASNNLTSNNKFSSCSCNRAYSTNYFKPVSLINILFNILISSFTIDISIKQRKSALRQNNIHA